MAVEVGDRIENKLELERQLGKGAWGEVWLARHLELDALMAVKILNQEVAQNQTAKQRFLREARSLARLRSPYIVQVFDCGLHDDRVFLAMEYLVGETLEERLQKSRVLLAADAARICTHIAKALQTAHDAGVIHRDVKPENVFLVAYDDEEIAKVVDFGIQKTVKGAGGKVTTLTRAGTMLGTPYYMSPEQLQDSGSVDHRTDLWALGVIAYECVTGKLPFWGTNLPNLIMAICSDPMPVPSQVASVPPGFDAWFQRAVARDRDERFDSAKAMSKELQRILFGGSRKELSGAKATAGGSSVPPQLLWSGTNPAIAWTPARPAIDDTSCSVASLNAQIAPVRPSKKERPPNRVRDVAVAFGLMAIVGVAGWVAYLQGRASKEDSATQPAATQFDQPAAVDSAGDLTAAADSASDLAAAASASAVIASGTASAPVSKPVNDPTPVKSEVRPVPRNMGRSSPPPATTPTVNPLPRDPFGDRY